MKLLTNIRDLIEVEAILITLVGLNLFVLTYPRAQM